MKALFVTFEGGEGAGKSTLIKSLCAYFSELGQHVVSTREPGGTLFGEELRNFLLHHRGMKICASAELALFLASRCQHIEERIKPELEKGSLVLSDRFTDSTVAYQGGGRGLGIDFVRDACYLVTSNFKPNLTFYIDIEPSLGLTRASKRAEYDKFEEEKIYFHERVRDAFLAIAKTEPHRFVILDGKLPPDALFELAKTEIVKRQSAS